VLCAFQSRSVIVSFCLPPAPRPPPPLPHFPTSTHPSLDQLEAASVKLFVEKFFTFFLLNASFIPIGLYVTMKLARSFQKVFLEADK
jgi:hypothetical protein